MKRAFITGGSGFVGKHLVAALVARGIEVRALARSDKAAAAVQAMGAEPVRGDLDGLTAMTEGMRGCDVVFHAAAHVEEHGNLAYLATQGVDAQKARDIPRWLASFVATVTAWMKEPPVTRTA